MKFTIASALTLISAVTAAPAPVPQAGPSYPLVLEPQSLSNYYVSSGRVDFGSTLGHVFKNNGQSSDITTLATFNIDPVHASRTCEFHFEADGPEAIVSGTRQIDIFTSLKGATQSAPSWPNGNLRDQHAGRIIVDATTKVGGYVEGFPNAAKSFPCPTGLLSGELVGAGDALDIYWTGLSKGAYILIN
jgi:hypothetical protein